VSYGVWKKVREDMLVLVGQPTEHKDRPIHGRRLSLGVEKGLAPVRAKMPTVTSIKEIKPGVCRVVYVNQIDVGGRVPVAVMNRTLLRNLALTSRIREHFAALRGLNEWDAEDGEAFGELLVMKRDAEKHHEKGETRVEARVRELMETHKGLKEPGEKWGWFEMLLKKVVANKLRPAGDSKAKLCNMSEKEANLIGGALASCSAANLSAPAAVDEWILRYPAMGGLEREYVLERSERKEELPALGAACVGFYGRGVSLRQPRFCPLLPQKSSRVRIKRAQKRRLLARSPAPPARSARGEEGG
jgi:hypothetical protein